MNGIVGVEGSKIQGAVRFKVLMSTPLKAPDGARFSLTLSQLITAVASAELLLFKVTVPLMTTKPRIGVAWLAIGASNK